MAGTAAPPRRRAAPLPLLLLLAALLPSSSTASGLPARVLTLNDGTFEHDTQASTGQTTGHWAVLFYDSSAARTRPAAETAKRALAALAASRKAALDGSNDEATPDPGCLYASVDASEEVNPLLNARFRGFLPGPVLLLFRDRQLFPLPLPRVMLSQKQLDRAAAGGDTDAARSAEQAVSSAFHAILSFLSEGFREVDSELIPPPAGNGGAVEKIVQFLASQKAELDGNYLMVAGVVLFAVGLILFVAAVGVTMVLTAGPPLKPREPGPPPKRRGLVKKGDKPIAPVPEEKEEEEKEKEEEKEEEKEAEAAAAEGVAEEQEEEDEGAAAKGPEAAALRRRRRQA
jgi:hypothetical protein